MIIKIKQTMLIIGDIIALYASLGITLYFRYGTRLNAQYVHAHLIPFTLLFVVWIAIFYIAGLYEARNLRNTIVFVRTFGISVFAGAMASISIFYAIPYFHISPKRNLAIFVGIFLVLGGLWRILFNRSIKLPQRRVLILGDGEELQEIASHIESNPQIGYEVAAHIAVPNKDHTAQHIIESHRPDTIIISEHLHAPALIKELAQQLMHGMEIMDGNAAYQMFFKKLPLSQVRELWLTARVSKQKRAYEAVKSLYEPMIGLVLLGALSPLLLLLYVLVRATSKGPGLYKQVRIGKKGEPFWIYKFRSMRQDAEKNGAVFAQHKDPRVTFVGKFLRFSHLDELPQLINIVRGEISFVGPRPERPEFVAQLKNKVPYYELRHVVKPGITGWAQVNYRANIDLINDTYCKLQYDMYYVQERSLVFDILTVLKTVKMFLFNYK